MIGLGALGDCEAPRSASSWFVAGGGGGGGGWGAGVVVDVGGEQPR